MISAAWPYAVQPTRDQGVSAFTEACAPDDVIPRTGAMIGGLRDGAVGRDGLRRAGGDAATRSLGAPGGMRY